MIACYKTTNARGSFGRLATSRPLAASEALWEL